MLLVYQMLEFTDCNHLPQQNFQQFSINFRQTFKKIQFFRIIRIQNSVQMYSPHHTTHLNYHPSLNSSITLPSTPTHTRTFSNFKSPQVPHSNPLDTMRVPSQKKLTITCQTGSSNRDSNRENENVLRKRGIQNYEQKQKFVSLQSSYIVEKEPMIQQRQTEKMETKDFRAQVQQKLDLMQKAYSNSLRELSFKIEELQNRLAINEKEIRNKNAQIQKLQLICHNQSKSLNRSQSDKVNQQMSAKIQDLDAKIRIIALHHEQTEDQHLQKYQKLTHSLVNYFGNKLHILKQKNSDFVRKGLLRLIELDKKLQCRNKTQKNQKIDRQGTQRTQGSMESVTESQISHQQSSDLIPDGGVSFWDDCFFDPTQKSQSYDLIYQMAKRRGQALYCWIDESGYLRYCDSNSYIYNRRGDRIKLNPHEANLLKQLKLLVII